MTTNNNSDNCMMTCWIVSVLAGLLMMATLMLLGSWGFIPAAFFGVIVAVILGLLLSNFVCSGSNAKEDLAQRNVDGPDTRTTIPAVAPSASSGSAASAAAPVAASAATAASSAVSAAPASAKAETAFEMQPSKPLSGQAELAARKGDWKYEAEAKVPAKKLPAKKAPVKKAPAKAAAAKAAPKPKATSKAAPKADAKPKRAAVAADGKPELLSAPRAGGADDLKLISGVGPKLEGMLNTMGVWHFEQVSGWRTKEVQWVNDNLEGFKGRVERDNWVAQSKVLAKGGETEFSARKKK